MTLKFCCYTIGSHAQIYAIQTPFWCNQIHRLHKLLPRLSFVYTFGRLIDKPFQIMGWDLDHFKLCKFHVQCSSNLFVENLYEVTTPSYTWQPRGSYFPFPRHHYGVSLTISAWYLCTTVTYYAFPDDACAFQAWLSMSEGCVCGHCQIWNFMASMFFVICYWRVCLLIKKAKLKQSVCLAHGVMAINEHLRPDFI